MNVHHHQVSLGGPLTGLLGEAGVSRGAARGTRAFQGTHTELAPCVGPRFEGQLGPVPGWRAVGPGQQTTYLVPQTLVDRFRIIEAQLLPAPGHLHRPLAAEVIGPTLENGIAEGPAQLVSQEWQVLAAQLVLEGLGGGGHDHPLTGEDGRNQVGQRLTGASAGLDHQVPAGGNGPGYRLGHDPLAFPGLASARQGPYHSPEGLGCRLTSHSRRLDGRGSRDMRSCHPTCRAM